MTLAIQEHVESSDIILQKQSSQLLAAWKAPIGESPMLQAQLERFQRDKPFEGLRILHCLPITHATLRKVDALIQGGAIVTLVAYQGVPTAVQQECIEIADKAGIKVFLKPEDVDGYYDYFLDCNAQLLTLTKNISPRFGYVEITRSGVERYGAHVKDLPVVSVDDSRSKLLETSYGTGDAAIRALTLVHKINLIGTRIVLFGYGKVGAGVARFLDKEEALVTVIDTNLNTLEEAKAKKFAVVNGTHLNDVLNVVSQADGVITATGNEGLISKLFSKQEELQNFSNKWLANIGADNEFGPAFANHPGLLNKGGAINFGLQSPTQMHFLDPTFCLHNEAILWMQNGEIGKGLHAVPEKYDSEALRTWTKIWPNEDVRELIF